MNLFLINIQLHTYYYSSTKILDIQRFRWFGRSVNIFTPFDGFSGKCKPNTDGSCSNVKGYNMQITDLFKPQNPPNTIDLATQNEGMGDVMTASTEE